MGKKSDTPKLPSAVAETPASPMKIVPAAATAKPQATTPPMSNGDGASAKKPVKKKPAKKTVKKKPITFSTEDIALRAYFIAEHRHRMGLHGDTHSDWIEAERQLKKERRAKAAKKKPRAKKRV